jgi:polysaccharide export outer membrane protein
MSRLTRYRLSLTSFGTIALAFLACALPVAAVTQTSTSTDCSNPLLSGTGSCSSQSAGTGITNTTGQMQQRQPDNAPVYVDSAGQRTNQNSDSTNQSQTFLPPDPVSDFQKLIRSSTGEILPLFGRDLFRRAPSTFAPADQIPVSADYIVGPGDEVLLRLWGAEQVNSNSHLTVDTSGNIYVPHVGVVHVAGLRMDQLQDQVSAEVNHVYRSYRIAISLGHLRSIQIYVVGEARKPGAYTISGLSTALNALFASGGPTLAGSMRRVQVRRGNQIVSELDLYEFVLKGDKSHDVRLESGDTIFIPVVGSQVAMAGSVRHPAVYELKDNTSTDNSLQDLLALAGGFSAMASTQQIRLERIDTAFQRRAMTIQLDAATRAMPLHDGDVLYANHIDSGFESSITIRGNLANPGRFAWKQGMHLSDILPDRAALLTGDYWRERNRMGVPTPLFEPYEYVDRPPVAGGSKVDSTLYRSPRRPTGPPSARDALTSVQPPAIDNQDSSQAALASSGVTSSSTLSMDQEAANAANSANNLSSAAVATSRNATLFDQHQQQIQQGSQESQSGQDQYGQPQRGQSINQTTDLSPAAQEGLMQSVVLATKDVNTIRLPAPEIDWSYAVIERLNPNTLKTSLIPFNLGKLIAGQDPNQNLELQPGDVVTILNQRDVLVPQSEQTKYIRLEGEFVGAGVYSADPNETLEHLVQRAGGFTPDAYLYGSSFLRESARAMQQQRLDEYITQLSTDLDRQTAITGASSTNGVSDPNALTLERNLVAQLRTLRATGRVVLEFRPDSGGLSSVPQIPLQNGDVFRVPSRPNTINVIGAVYAQNVFLYNPKRRLNDYMSLAGRPNRVADKDHAFIIRADGSVFSRERARRILSNHFDEATIYPGDSIVIPEKLIKPTLTRQLLDYSQILSGFGLAAAAIQVIR